MGTYICPIKDKLKPKTHDDSHWDGSSYTCPVLRDEMEKALNKENWKRLKKLSELAVEYFI
jgi:hypothetical protein